MITAPQSFIIREECDKATSQNGFRRKLGEDAGWAAYESTTANGRVFLAARGNGGPWLLALDHPGVIVELNHAPEPLPGPGRARYSFDQLSDLYLVLARVYALARSLPDGPLETFIAQTTNLPRTTEIERLVVQRIGQDIFRDRLMSYWGAACPLTGINDSELLRASHIKPWARCDSDAERLSVHNGLLLSALWDATFDAGLATFDDEGAPLFSPQLKAAARTALVWSAPLNLTPQHRTNLAWHRENIFVQK